MFERLGDDPGLTFARIGFALLLAGLVGLVAVVATARYIGDNANTDAGTFALRAGLFGSMFLVPLIPAGWAAWGRGGPSARLLAAASSLLLAVFLGLLGLLLFGPAALFLLGSAARGAVDRAGDQQEA